MGLQRDTAVAGLTGQYCAITRMNQESLQSQLFVMYFFSDKR